ncbi:MAG: sulfotransferase [Xanthomonadales bacterium]|nr:sulfotransferase [Xanthomonadales bacterium]
MLAAPRSGSTLLFETLAEAPDIWTVGGESHRYIEGLRRLHSVAGGIGSNRLDESHATPRIVEVLRRRFARQLRDRDGRRFFDNQHIERLRFLEKTPKNALRQPFLETVFPGSLYVFLVRDPRPNISSMMEAWKGGKFVTYPRLPGWQGLRWSLLLPPGWQQLKGRPLAEVCAYQWATANRIILDDLGRLPADRWTACSYEALTADPQPTIERICRFAGLATDDRLRQRIAAELPLSRSTQTRPDPDKWRRNEDEILPVVRAGHDFGVHDIWQRCREAAGT